jgi:hypothetical protein
VNYYEDDRIPYRCEREDCRGYARSRRPWYEVTCQGTLSSPHAPKKMESIYEKDFEAPTVDLVVSGAYIRDGKRHPVEYSHELGRFVTPDWATKRGWLG